MTPVRPPWREDLGVFFAPIRHHSPACAFALQRLLDEVRPAYLLVEAPSDFETLLPILADAATRPPIAIVAFAPAAAKTATDADAAEVASVSYFPFCASSPEYVAIAYGHERAIPVRFIDLAMHDRRMWPTVPDDEAGADANRTDDADANVDVLTQERVFDSSDYVRELCNRTGCRDHNELWDRLFETRLGDGDWRAFFTEVGTYCAHVRATSVQSASERRQDDAREDAMVAGLARARAETSGPIVVVTGGFHTPALLDAAGASPAGRTAAPRATAKTPPVSAYVIRYGFEQLDRLNGYASGMPLPGYYDRLWRAAGAGATGAALWTDVAVDVLVAFAAHLRATEPALALSLPGLSAAVQHAVALARLRGRPGPGREELLDAVRSTFVKGEHGVEFDPLLARFRRFLSGTAIGDIPASAGSPPLVESVRAAAARFGLRIDDGERRRRELDIHRNESHRTLSRFLHATALVRSGFAERTAGPDFSVGAKTDILFESWSYAWSPMVEARLIELASGADSLERACVAELRRAIAALVAAGHSRSAPAFVPLLVTALQAGLDPVAAGLAAALERALADDGDFASIVAALRDLDVVWRARGALQVADPAPVGALVTLAFERALYLLPDIARADEARLSDALDGLATLRTIADDLEDGAPRERFREAIGALVADDLPPAIEGAVAATAFLCGMLPAEHLAARIRGTVESAYLDAAERVAYVRGVVAISRELLWALPELLDELDAILERVDEDEFVALLPHIRLAFATLDPRETDRVAEHLAERYGTREDAFAGSVAYDVGADELLRNLALAREFDRAVAADGLGAWLGAPEPAA